jgi:hypothetical protein
MSDAPTTCALPSCNGDASWRAGGKRGWCRAHYRRWQRHGDPQAGRTPVGEPGRYLTEVVLAYEGEECLSWPYGKDKAGYAQIGRHDSVSRLVCESVNGPPPTTRHQAAHSCGNGHNACCNKQHLSWKTPIENQADRVTHGTSNRGERHGCAQLNSADVAEIRSHHGKPVREIAAHFGVSVSHVVNIIAGRAWAALP